MDKVLFKDETFLIEPIIEKEWNEFVKSDKKVFYVRGESGIKKFSCLYNFLKNKNYQCIIYNSLNIPPRSQFKDEIKDIMENGFGNIVIIFQKLQSIYSVNNTTINDLEQIIDGLEKRKNKHICITATNNYFKKIVNIEKNSHIVDLSFPTEEELFEWIMPIFKKRDIIITKSFHKDIYPLFKRDFRQYYQVLYYLTIQKEPEKKQFVTKKMVSEVLTSWICKTKNNTLLSICDTIFYKNPSKDDSIIYYDMQKSLLPLIIHENFKSILMQNLNQPLSIIKQTSNLLSFCDMIEYLIYSFNNNELQSFYAILLCNVLSTMYRKYFQEPIFKPELKFTTLLNKTSLCQTYMHTFQNNAPKVNYIYFDKELVYMSNIIFKEKGLKNKKMKKKILRDVDRLINCS